MGQGRDVLVDRGRNLAVEEEDQTGIDRADKEAEKMAGDVVRSREKGDREKEDEETGSARRAGTKAARHSLGEVGIEEVVHHIPEGEGSPVAVGEDILEVVEDHRGSRRLDNMTLLET